jgi:hypothetical protein
MTFTNKQLALLVAITAAVSVLLAYLVMSLAQPQPVVASDKQIVNAIEKTIGRYDYTGNSLRSSLHKDLSAVERAVADVEGAVRDFCNAHPETTSCGF